MKPVRCQKCRRWYRPETPDEEAAQIGPICGNRRRHRPRIRSGQQDGPDLLTLLEQPMDLEQMLTAVNKIPGGDGWWHSSGGDTYRELAKQLAQHMPPAAALDVLTTAFSAAADEYGG